MAHLWICLHIIAHCCVLKSWWQCDEVHSQVCSEDTLCVSTLGLAREDSPDRSFWVEYRGHEERITLEGDRVLFPVLERSYSSALERGLLPLNTIHLTPSLWQKWRIGLCRFTWHGLFLLWNHDMSFTFQQNHAETCGPKYSPEKNKSLFSWGFPSFKSGKHF